jgi:diaminopimelate decarboxylase
VVLIEGYVRKLEESVRLNVGHVWDFRKSFHTFVETYHWILEPGESAVAFMGNLGTHILHTEGNAEIKVSFRLNDHYALEGSLPFGCRAQFTFEQLKELQSHPAVYGLELILRDIPERKGYGSRE